MRDSGLVVWFSLRVREVPGSIPGCPRLTFNFNVMFQETSWSILSRWAPKRKFQYCLRDIGLVVWFTLRIVGCKRSRVSIPGCPLFPFSFNAMIQETSWIFPSCRVTKRNFPHCLRDSGLVVWFYLRVRELPGSIPSCTLFPFSFKVIFQETSWKFSSCRAPKRNFRYCLRDSDLVVWFTLRVLNCERSRVQIPDVPFPFQLWS